MSEFKEMYHLWAESVREGRPFAISTAQVFGRKLRDIHLAYVANCEHGLDHHDAVEGTRLFAAALWGCRPDGEPFWSNNQRRAAGLGPMPWRAVLWEKGRRAGDSSTA